MDDSAQVAMTMGPRERAGTEGIDSLADAELVALLLGHGVRGQPVLELALHLLRATGGLEGLGRVGPAFLSDVPGVGQAKALRIAAGVEIGRRITQRPAMTRARLNQPAEVAAAYGPRLAGLDHEQMWVLSLDGRQRLRGARRVAQGGRHGLVVTAREILAAALADAASGFVLVHNHPSGDPKPSAADVEMTVAVAAAAEVVGIPLLDHVIVSERGRYASLLDAGLIPGEAARVLQ